MSAPAERAPSLTLWQINISHFAEKARWALDHKRAPHVRRSPPPAVHSAVALWLSRGETAALPVLEIDGVAVSGSSAIIAALEQHFPDPPLYPADPAERRRALELEQLCDAEIGPNLRLLVWHELLREPELLAELAAQTFPPHLRDRKRLAGAWTRAFVSYRYGAGDDAAAARARTDLLAALDRLDAALEAGGGEYLAGGAFSVADLTAASLLNPAVGAPQGTLPPGLIEMPEPFRELCGELSRRPCVPWVLEIYRRHRDRARPVGAEETLAAGPR